MKVRTYGELFKAIMSLSFEERDTPIEIKIGDRILASRRQKGVEISIDRIKVGIRKDVPTLVLDLNERYSIEEREDDSDS